MRNSVSDTSVAVTRKIPWKFVLPSITFAATVSLFHLHEIWLRGAAVWDDLPVTSPTGLAVVLKGAGPLFNFFGWFH